MFSAFVEPTLTNIAVTMRQTLLFPRSNSDFTALKLCKAKDFKLSRLYIKTQSSLDALANSRNVLNQTALK